MNHSDLLKEFHSKYGHFIGEVHQTVPMNVRKLRKDLIQEEIRETIDAIDENNLIEIADGICDSMYVLVGTAISYGFPIERLFLEVHRSNMTKTAIKAENGEKYGTKTPKGPDFIPPDIYGILYHPERQTKLEQLAVEQFWND